MADESRLEQTAHGLTPATEGWFVLNAREAPWRAAPGRPAVCDFEGAHAFAQVGVKIDVLAPGEPIGMYHWEADQEDFLVLSGTPLLIIEGQERPLRAWDLVHCPPDVAHIIVGAGEGPSLVVAIGARQHQDGPGWGGYTVDETARRHGVCVAEETNDPHVAYASVPKHERVRYEEGWLPD
ncbi:MAG: cupin protein [Solirubrobacterales bacterium]|nr:cupin protein [Solirubrobacterales bacterium]